MEYCEKRILLLTTGGTIASLPGSDGLQPQQGGEELLAAVGAVSYRVDVQNILNLDSTNIQPEEWQLIAERVYTLRKGYDGVVITHGTDTMAYTASMLTFMLPGIDLPVVLTGSQLPMLHPLSDAPGNLRCAMEMAVSGIPGVFIAFDRKVMLGCRSVKVRTTGFDAFESVKAPLAAYYDADGFHFAEDMRRQPVGTCRLCNSIDSHVILLKLIPGFSLDLFRALPGIGVKGVVVEAFGSGGLNFFRRNLISVLGGLVDEGISVVVCSQCLYERSDLTRYEVGVRALRAGVIPGEDMTSECAVTKLMWALGQGMNQSEIARFFETNVAGEMTQAAYEQHREAGD